MLTCKRCSTSNNHSSLQTFYDTIENHMRGLSSLGKSPDTYGSLLTPIILTKLPNEIKKNLARQNTNLVRLFNEKK